MRHSKHSNYSKIPVNLRRSKKSWKRFSKKPLTKKTPFFTALPRFPTKRFQLHYSKICIKSRNYHCQKLRTLIFDFDVAPKPFSEIIPIKYFGFKQFWRLFLAVPENTFKFVNRKLAKLWKMLFTNIRNIRFWLQGSLTTIF